MKNLEKAINKINQEWDGLINLQLDKKGKRIFDENEFYNIDFVETRNCEMESCAEEFGFKFTPQNEDKIMIALETALKKDLKDENAFLEWEDCTALNY